MCTTVNTFQVKKKGCSVFIFEMHSADSSHTFRGKKYYNIFVINYITSFFILAWNVLSFSCHMYEEALIVLARYT